MILRIQPPVIVLLFIYCLLGCAPTTKPLVWKAKDLVISDFSAFKIQPVLNATGKNIEQEILFFLTAHLKEQFGVHNLKLNGSRPTKSEILTVQSEVLLYEVKSFMSPAPPLKNMIGRCILRTRLFQESSADIAAEIITINQVDVGQGLFAPKEPERVLQESAAAVAREIANMM